MKKEIMLLNYALINAIEQTIGAAYLWNGVCGVSSGFPDIDKITKGWQDGELILFAGYENMGVGKFLISMAMNMGIVNETSLAYFSLQKSYLSLVQTMRMNLSGLSLDKIMSGQLTDKEWIDLNKVDERLSDKPIYLYDAPNPSIDEIAEKAEQLVQNEDVKILLIDNICAIATNNPNDDGMAKTAHSLKILARELNIPILAAFEIKDEPDTATFNYGKRPERLHFQKEEQIFEKADCVCLLHRPEYFRNVEEEERNSIIGKGELILQNHKDVKPNVVKFITKMEFSSWNTT